MAFFSLPLRWLRLAALRLLGCSLLGGVTLAVAAPAHALMHKSSAHPFVGKADPDSMLIAIYKDLSANNLRQAQEKADALVQAYPTFSLGQMIRGDLLMAHTRALTGLGVASNGAPEKLEDLREEAMVRLNSLRARPDPEAIPRVLLKMRDDQRTVLVVDARRSRLYVYQIVNGQPHMVTDYYITQGKLGTSKSKEGDQKTPIGVYYITGRLGRSRLPDFYGAGALPINYPNEWDRLNGRSGSGIWLHGTPSTNYSRPPLSSDGCVVLTNPDLQKLLASVQPGKTPIVITDRVEFISKANWKAERDAADLLLDGWRRDVETLDAVHFVANYSSKFKSAQGDDLATWLGKAPQAMPPVKPASVKLQDVSIFAYPGRTDLIVSTFTQDATFANRHHALRKRQYWQKEGREWKIVYEGNL